MKKIFTLLFLGGFILTTKAQFKFDIAGADNTYVSGMNDLGEVVGWYEAGAVTNGFYYNGVDTFLIHYPGSTQCWCSGINNNHYIVGRYNTTGSAVDNLPYRYQLGSYQPINPGTGGNTITCNDVNIDTCVSGDFKVGTNYKLYKYCGTGIATVQEYIDPGTNVLPTYGSCINDNGMMAGYVIDGGLTYGLIWTGNGIMDTVDISYNGSRKTKIWGMNNAFAVVGTMGNTHGFMQRNFVTASHNIEAINIEGATEVYPRDINNNEQICGYYTDVAGHKHGFIFYSYDNGFRPDKNGYSFYNSKSDMWPHSEEVNNQGDPYTGNPQPSFLQIILNKSSLQFPYFPERVFPSWPLFVAAYTEAACYVTDNNGVKTPKPSATQFWVSHIRDDFHGACYGFTSSTILAYDDFLSYSSRYGFSGVTASDQTYVHPLDANIRKVANMGQIFQWSDQYRDHMYDNDHQTPNECLAKVKSVISSGTHQNITLALSNQNGSGKHSVLPFKVTHGTPLSGDEFIFIYDPNFPGDTTRNIRIATLNGSDGVFYYQTNTVAGSNVQWGGLDQNGGLVADIAGITTGQVPIIGSMTQAFNNVSRSAEPVSIYTTDSAKVVITDGSSLTTGFQNGLAFNHIPLSAVLYSDAGYPSNPIGYALSDANVDLTLVNETGTRANASAFYADRIFTYQRNDATPAQTDLLNTNGSFTLHNTDAATKQVNFSSILKTAAGEILFQLDSMAINQNDQISFERIDTTVLEVRNTGTATTYNLSVSVYFPSNVASFHFNNIPIGGNMAHDISPFVDSLASAGVLIYVDSLQNGNYEDTLFFHSQSPPQLVLSRHTDTLNVAGGTDSIGVANLGAGTLAWNVTSSASWLNITAGSTGTQSGKIMFSYGANSASPRSGYVVITAAGAFNSPDSVFVYQDAATGISLTDNNDNTVLIYPNPTADILNLRGDNSTGSAGIELRDDLGRMLYQIEVNGNTISEQLDLSRYDRGIYLLVIKANNKPLVTKRIVKN